MRYLTAISENPQLAVLLFGAVMLLSELTFYKKNLHYNTESIGGRDMTEHPLNKMYQLDKRVDIDVPMINRRITVCHICVIVASCLVMLVNIYVGAGIFLVGSVVASLLVVNRIGKEFSTHPFKDARTPR